MNPRIKILKEKLNESKFFKSLKKYNYFPKTLEEFQEILEKKAKSRVKNLNDIDVSQLKELRGFSKYKFFTKTNFFVDEFDVSNVRNFGFCFSFCYNFNSDLSNWNVSNGEDFNMFFFECSSFNQKILNFNFRNAKVVTYFLSNTSSFNQDVYTFVFNKNLKDLSGFFKYCLNFNQDVLMLDVSNIENFKGMFYGCKNFLQDLSDWDVSSAVKWDYVFDYTPMLKHPELMPEKFRENYLK